MEKESLRKGVEKNMIMNYFGTLVLLSMRQQIPLSALQRYSEQKIKCSLKTNISSGFMKQMNQVNVQFLKFRVACLLGYPNIGLNL